MELLFLYLKDYKCHTNLIASFNSNWRFTLSQNGKEISVKRVETVPSGFFSFRRNSSDAPIENISAIIGANGSGKTSIMTFFSDLALKDVAGYPRIGSYVAVVIENQTLYLYSSEDMRAKWSDESICASQQSEYKYELSGEYPKTPLEEVFTVIYYSPHMTTENVFHSSDEHHLCDLSTGAFWRDGSIRHQHRFGRRKVDFYSYNHEEKRRIIRFLSDYWRGVEARQVRKLKNLPLPKSVVLRYEQEHGEEIKNWFLRTCSRAMGLRLSQTDRNEFAGLCECTDLFVCMFMQATNIYLRRKVSREFQSRLMEFYRELWVAVRDNLPTRANRGPLYERLIRFLNEDWHIEGGPHPEITGRQEMLRKFFTLAIDHYWNGMTQKQREGVIHQIVLPINSDSDLVKLLGLSRAHRNLCYWGDYDFVHFDFDPPVSSGEASYLSMFGRIYGWFRDNNLTQGSTHALLFMDEAETTLHPSLQRDLVWNMIWLFENFFPDARVHIVFGSHSPMLLSDIPKGNVVFLPSRGISLPKMMNSLEELRNTFAADIFDLYKLSFFMEDGTCGRFATKKVDDWLRYAHKPTKKPPQMSFELVGDDLVREYVRRRLLSNVQA